MFRISATRRRAPQSPEPWWHHNPKVLQRPASFNDRQSSAASAKQALLDRFRAHPAADDPAVQARAAEQKAMADARDARAAERKTAKDAEAARVVEDRATAAAQEATRLAEEATAVIAREDEERRLAAEATTRKATTETEAKARRDAKYAARKSRDKA